MQPAEARRTANAPDPAPLAAALQSLVTADRSVRFGIPGAVFAVSDTAGATSIVSLGVDAKGVPLTADSLYPLNSATKLATGLLILKLLDDGGLLLDDPLSKYLPEARAADDPGVTIRRLLSHTSGLTLEPPHDLSQPPGSLIYTADMRWPGELANACLAAVPAQRPGTGVRYSNIGFGLLGLVAERVAGAPFAELLYGHVLRPLRIEASFARPPDRAPMAIGVWDMASPYLGTELEPFNCTAWHLMGAPWTGLLVTAAGLLALVRAYLDGGGILKPETARLAHTNQTHGLAGGFVTKEPFIGRTSSKSIAWTPCTWGLAVEVQGGKRPHWASSRLPNSFGQIGSSGCLGWCDPESGIAWALLGARSTDSGWLVFHGTRIANAAFAAVQGAPPAEPVLPIAAESE